MINLGTYTCRLSEANHVKHRDGRFGGLTFGIRPMTHLYFLDLYPLRRSIDLRTGL